MQSIGSMFGTAGGLTPPPTFNMPNMGGAANNLYGGIQGLQSTYGGLGAGVLPQAQTTAQNLYNNPFSGPALGGAQVAAGLGQGAAGTGYATGASLIPYAENILTQGMDPQSALYARTAQTVQDQVRAGEAARGIATTPYGAGLENKAMSDFNIDWQNSQLQRSLDAARGGGALAGQGVGMMGAAAPQWLTSAMYPYATFSDIGQGQFGALSSLLGIGQQGQGIAQTGIQDWNQYLGTGNQAGQVANQNFANQLRQNQQNWSQLGGLGAGIGSLIGGPFGGMLGGGLGSLAGNVLSGGAGGFGGNLFQANQVGQGNQVF